MGDWEFISWFKVQERRPGTSFGLILWDGGESKSYHLLFGLSDEDKLTLEGSLPKRCGLTPLFEVLFKVRNGLLKVEKSGDEYGFYFKEDLNES
ncbi:MAG: hypothetical protein H5T91_06125 [Synergistetes bacterium]|nr:hypothetical protein [Synergistota bacterium]